MAIKGIHNSISLADIISRVSESDILSYYLNIRQIPCVINCPFRKDSKPSLGLHSYDGKRIFWTDFATNQRGGVFDLLMLMFNKTYSEILEKVYNDIVVYTKPLTKHNNIIITKSYSEFSNTKLECKIRDWKNYDIAYWNSYGITLPWLKWAEVYPISHKIVIKNGNKCIFGAEKYAYTFVEHKENNTTIKIYQPFSKNYKWSNGHNGSVISLWTKIPNKGDKLIIASSLKDALCISCQTNIPAIAVQGEGYDISDTVISNLKSRYNKIYVSFDTDDPGLNNTKRLCERTGFIEFIPNLGVCKDYSDYYKSLENKEVFKNLFIDL